MKSSDGANLDQQFKHQTAEVNGVRIHYVIGGKGEAVVLLHGFPQTRYEWHKVMPRRFKPTIVDFLRRDCCSLTEFLTVKQFLSKGTA